jgi:hypothetical protein
MLKLAAACYQLKLAAASGRNAEARYRALPRCSNAEARYRALPRATAMLKLATACCRNAAAMLPQC